MASASPREALMARCRCGMLPMVATSSPIMDIPMLWKRWPGRLMASASPRRVTITQCRCGWQSKRSRSFFAGLSIGRVAYRPQVDQSSGIAGDHPTIYRRGGQGFDRRMMLLVYDGGKVCTRAPCLDRPTNTIFAVRLTPETLGKLLHSTLRGEHLTVLLLQPTTEVFVGPGIIRAEEATRRIVCRPLKQKEERVKTVQHCYESVPGSGLATTAGGSADRLRPGPYPQSHGQHWPGRK